MHEHIITVGLDHVPAEHDVLHKIVGKDYSNFEYIQRGTGAVLEVTGKGTDEIDRVTGRPSEAPLQIVIRVHTIDCSVCESILIYIRQLEFHAVSGHVDAKEVEATRLLLESLINNVRERFKDLKKEEKKYCSYCNMHTLVELYDAHCASVMHLKRKRERENLQGDSAPSEKKYFRSSQTVYKDEDKSSEAHTSSHTPQSRSSAPAAKSPNPPARDSSSHKSSMTITFMDPSHLAAQSQRKVTVDEKLPESGSDKLLSRSNHGPRNTPEYDEPYQEKRTVTLSRRFSNEKSYTSVRRESPPRKNSTSHESLKSQHSPELQLEGKYHRPSRSKSPPKAFTDEARHVYHRSNSPRSHEAAGRESHHYSTSPTRSSRSEGQYHQRSHHSNSPARSVERNLPTYVVNARTSPSKSVESRYRPPSPVLSSPGRSVSPQSLSERGDVYLTSPRSPSPQKMEVSQNTYDTHGFTSSIQDLSSSGTSDHSRSPPSSHTINESVHVTEASFKEDPPAQPFSLPKNILQLLDSVKKAADSGNLSLSDEIWDTADLPGKLSISVGRSDSSRMLDQIGQSASDACSSSGFDSRYGTEISSKIPGLLDDYPKHSQSKHSSSQAFHIPASFPTSSSVEPANRSRPSLQSLSDISRKTAEHRRLSPPPWERKSLARMEARGPSLVAETGYKHSTSEKMDSRDSTLYGRLPPPWEHENIGAHKQPGLSQYRSSSGQPDLPSKMEDFIGHPVQQHVSGAQDSESPVLPPWEKKQSVVHRSPSPGPAERFSSPYETPAKYNDPSHIPADSTKDVRRHNMNNGSLPPLEHGISLTERTHHEEFKMSDRGIHLIEKITRELSGPRPELSDSTKAGKDSDVPPWLRGSSSEPSVQPHPTLGSGIQPESPVSSSELLRQKHADEMKKNPFDMPGISCAQDVDMRKFNPSGMYSSVADANPHSHTFRNRSESVVDTFCSEPSESHSTYLSKGITSHSSLKLPGEDPPTILETSSRKRPYSPERYEKLPGILKRKSASSNFPDYSQSLDTTSANLDAVPSEKIDSSYLKWPASRQQEFSRDTNSKYLLERPYSSGVISVEEQSMSESLHKAPSSRHSPERSRQGSYPPHPSIIKEYGHTRQSTSVRHSYEEQPVWQSRSAIPSSGLHGEQSSRQSPSPVDPTFTKHSYNEQSERRSRSPVAPTTFKHLYDEQSRQQSHSPVSSMSLRRSYDERLRNISHTPARLPTAGHSHDEWSGREVSNPSTVSTFSRNITEQDMPKDHPHSPGLFSHDRGESGFEQDPQKLRHKFSSDEYDLHSLARHHTTAEIRKAPVQQDRQGRLSSIHHALDKLTDIHRKQISERNIKELHQQALGKVSISSTGYYARLKQTPNFCKLCTEQVDDMNRHSSSVRHNMMYLELQINLGLQVFSEIFGDVPFIGMDTEGGRRLAVVAVESFTHDVLPEDLNEANKYCEIVILLGKVTNYKCSLCVGSYFNAKKFVEHISSPPHTRKCLDALLGGDDVEKMANVVWPCPRVASDVIKHDTGDDAEPATDVSSKPAEVLKSCEFCDVASLNREDFSSHLGTRSHHHKVERCVILWCHLCQSKMSLHGFVEHVTRMAHIDLVDDMKRVRWPLPRVLYEMKLSETSAATSDELAMLDVVRSTWPEEMDVVDKFMKDNDTNSEGNEDIDTMGQKYSGVFCNLCNMQNSTLSTHLNHCRSARHLEMEEASGQRLETIFTVIKQVSKPLYSGFREEALKEILKSTGYSHKVSPYQRKYGGPPPGVTGKIPGPGHEIIVGCIPVSIFEDQLIPMFEKFGEIWELVLALDSNTATSYGFCFITYFRRQDAETAARKMNLLEIGEGSLLRCEVVNERINMPIKVVGLEKKMTKREIFEEFHRRTAGLVDVHCDHSPDNPTRINPGYATLRYSSLRSTLNAFDKLFNKKVVLYGVEIGIYWLGPWKEIDPSLRHMVDVLLIDNLKYNITESHLFEKFKSYGELKWIRKLRNNARVKFAHSEAAQRAMHELNGKNVRDSVMSIKLCDTHIVYHNRKLEYKKHIQELKSSQMGRN